LKTPQNVAINQILNIKIMTRKNITKLIIISIISIVYFASCDPTAKKEVVTKEPTDTLALLREHEQMNKNILAIPKRQPVALHVKRELDLKVTGEVNLVRKQVDLRYDITSRFKQPQSLLIKPQISLNDSINVTLKEDEKVPMEISKKVDIKQLTTKTSVSKVRPYLLLKEDSPDYKLLSGNYTVDIRLNIPENARIIKSSVPLERISRTEMALKMENVPVLPSLDIWYTTAEENITIRKIINKNVNPVEVSLVIKNNTRASISGINLSSEFPNSVLQPSEEKSDGRFVLQDGVMYKWTSSIKLLSPGATKTIKFYLFNTSPEIPFREPKVLAHNKDGDLIAIE